MMERLLSLLDIVVLDREPAGSFRALAPFPSWFLQYYPNANPATVHLDWAFLTEFLYKAQDFWDAAAEGSINSGPWSETDTAGKEKMLLATAVFLSGRKILLIEPARVPLEDAQVLLQKGRQKNLDFRTVKRKQRSLRKVQQRYLTLLDAVPDWILVVHKDGSLLEYSTGLDDLFPDIQMQVGTSIKDLLPPDLGEQLLSQCVNVISSGRPQMWRYRSPDHAMEILVLATGEDEALCVLRKK